MTNNINTNLNRPFDKMGKGFSLPTPLSSTPKTADSTTVTKPTLDHDEVVKHDDGTKKKPLGKIVFGSMLAAGVVALALTRGFSGSTASRIRRVADKWEDDFLKYACKNKAINSIDDKIIKTSRSVKKLFDLSDAIANFTAIKDTIFHTFTSWDFVNPAKRPKLHKFLNKYIPMQKVCDFFTKHVLKISVSAVDAKYAKVSSALDGLETGLRSAFGGVKSKLPVEKAQKLEQMIGSINTVYRKGFDKTARNNRLANIFENVKHLARDVKEGLLSPFKKKEKKGAFRRIYSSYVTQTMSASAQKSHKKALDSAKLVFSNDISDVYTKLRTTAGELKHCFAPEDKESRLLFGELLNKLENYKAMSGSAEANSREMLQKEILEKLMAIKTSFAKSSAADMGKSALQVQKNLQNANELIDGMKDIMENSSQKGLMQNILSELKGVVSDKEYKRLKAQTIAMNEKLNEAIDKEGNNLFNKIAESRVGSIPTDMLGLATMAGTGAWAISKGKDKDEKVGATLKVGIPLLGGIGAYFIAASRAFSGTTNLLFGAITTLGLNKIGEAIFDYYQKRFVQNKSMKEIAIDTYDKATSV